MAEEEVDWNAVASTLRRMIDEIMASMSELCELGYPKACVTISEQVLPILNRMLRYAESRIPTGYYERDTERKLRQEIFAVAGSISDKELEKVRRLMDEIVECRDEGAFADARRAYENYILNYIAETGDVPEYEESLSEWYFVVTGKYPPSLYELERMYEETE